MRKWHLFSNLKTQLFRCSSIKGSKVALNMPTQNHSSINAIKKPVYHAGKYSIFPLFKEGTRYILYSLNIC